jgi:hypothetical protein
MYLFSMFVNNHTWNIAGHGLEAMIPETLYVIWKKVSDTYSYVPKDGNIREGYITK